MLTTLSGFTVPGFLMCRVEGRNLLSFSIFLVLLPVSLVFPLFGSFF